MNLDRLAREYYRVAVTTDPVSTSTDWAATFDGGATWVDAVDVDGDSAWLVAGPDADPDDAVVITASMTPRLRMVDNPEIVVRRAPSIYLV